MLEVDFESFFDSIDRGHLQQILRQRVRDGVLLRLIGKWLRAGVTENGCVYHPDSGTPQGGVITPPTQLSISIGAPLSRGRSSAGERLTGGGDNEKEAFSGHRQQSGRKFRRCGLPSRFELVSSQRGWQTSICAPPTNSLFRFVGWRSGRTARNETQPRRRSTEARRRRRRTAGAIHEVRGSLRPGFV